MMKPAHAWYQDPKELRKRREEVGLSAEVLAQLAGKSKSVVKNIESGRTKLRGEIADLLWGTLADAKLAREKKLKELGSVMSKEDTAKQMGRLVPWNSPPDARLSEGIRLHYPELRRLRELSSEIFELKAQVDELQAEVTRLRIILAKVTGPAERVVETLHQATADEGVKILEKDEIPCDIADGSKS